MAGFLQSRHRARSATQHILSAGALSSVRAQWQQAQGPRNGSRPASGRPRRLLHLHAAAQSRPDPGGGPVSCPGSLWPGAAAATGCVRSKAPSRRDVQWAGGLQVAPASPAGGEVCSWRELLGEAAGSRPQRERVGRCLPALGLTGSVRVLWMPKVPHVTPAWVPGPGPWLGNQVQMTGGTPGLGLQLQASLTHDAGTGSQRQTLTLVLRPRMQQAGGGPPEGSSRLPSTRPPSPRCCRSRARGPSRPWAD